VDVNPNTIIRILKRKGINPRRAARKLFLTAAQANLRLEFAFHFMNETEAFWQNAIFTDEKTFG
jgi:hypothetical protein